MGEDLPSNESGGLDDVVGMIEREDRVLVIDRCVLSNVR